MFFLSAGKKLPEFWASGRPLLAGRACKMPRTFGTKSERSGAMNPTALLESDAVREPALALFEPEAHASYSLETAARLAGISRYRVALYCRHGFIAPAVDPMDGGWRFDGQAVRTVRQLEQFREQFGVNLEGTRLLLSLAHEIDELRRELRHVREPDE
jgi:MerR family transcriptional regulator/heat shock protein HspR